MNFRVGQKVVAVDDPETWGDWWYRIHHPSKYDCPIVGQIYTVANVFTLHDHLCLEIVEIYAPREKWWGAGFLASGFRPVVERKTDISVFTKILDDVQTKRTAVVD